MAKLFLIDHSLRDVGGHHFDYVYSVANAAQCSGLAVTIGCHQDFKNQVAADEGSLVNQLQELGEVKAVFRRTVYQGDSWLAGLRACKRSAPIQASSSGQRKDSGFGQLWRSVDRCRVARRRQRVVNSFERGLRRYFRSGGLPGDGDMVLVGAASELELAGVANFLSSHSAAAEAQWHLLFHFNLFDGWRSEYASQRDALQRTRTDFLKSIALNEHRNLHFHTTTETLADQFNELGVGRFDSLPYPISNDFLPTVPRTRQRNRRVSGRPLRLVCAGATRREKGQAARLQNLVDGIEQSCLLTNKVKLVVQRPHLKRPSKPRLELKSSSNAIEYVRHPLPRTDYHQLLQSADIGLFCYDSRAYFGRCAGILVEMLAAGKPVVVPAGTWLADQIQEPIQNYVRQFKKRNIAHRSLKHGGFGFDRANAPGTGGVWSFDQEDHPFVATTQRDAEDQLAVVEFGWHWPKQHGVYARVECVQMNEAGEVIDVSAQAVGASRRGNSSMLMFRLADEARRFEFRLRGAFGSGTVSIRNFCVDLYHFGQGGQHVPTGAVGAIAASPSELPDCVREVAENFEHYRETAQAFANHWVERHHPQRTIDRLANRVAALAKVA